MAVVLHRCRTPTDWLCPCGRVARALRRAGEDVDVVRVPWRRSERYTVQALSGQTIVPVVDFGGEAVCDSRRIVEHIGRRTGSTPEPG